MEKNTTYIIMHASNDLVGRVINTVPLPVVMFKAGLLAAGIPECRIAHDLPEGMAYVDECRRHGVIPYSRAEVTHRGDAFDISMHGGCYYPASEGDWIVPCLKGRAHTIEIEAPEPAQKAFNELRQDSRLGALLASDYSFDFASIVLSDKGEMVEEKVGTIMYPAGVFYNRKENDLILRTVGLKQSDLEKAVAWFRGLK